MLMHVNPAYFAHVISISDSYSDAMHAFGTYPSFLFLFVYSYKVNMYNMVIFSNSACKVEIKQLDQKS